MASLTGYVLIPRGTYGVLRETACIALASDGTLLGKILVPETVANLCFGGRDGHRLFITAKSSVYCTFVETKGAEPWTRSRRG